MQPTWPASESAPSRPKYVGRIVPLHFPESATVPESQLHLDLRTLLYQLLSAHLGQSVTVGSDQFVYLDASNPKRCIAPDVYAKATPRGEPIRSWKLWERGAPDVAVEIVSESDAGDASWDEKFALYRALGVKELVRFDLVSGGPPLRVWHRTQEELAELEVSNDAPVNTPYVASMVFDFHWVIAPTGVLQQTLRIASGSSPLVLIPTDAEAREAERQAKEAERQAKEAAEARVRELEALLAAKS
jgi:Uma2 family endonuclease